MSRLNRIDNRSGDQQFSAIHDLIPENVISQIYSFVNKGESENIEYNSTMIETIEDYIDSNSSRWIYSPILRNNPESRYIILLIHFFDRNPSIIENITELLPKSTQDQITNIKKSFKLGC